MTFDGQGMLVGVATSRTSALSGALEAAASAPGAFASGAESVGHVQKSLFEGRRASADAELARLGKDIGLRQQRVVAGGVLPEDVAELQQLQRAQSILNAQRTVSGADPALVGEFARHVEASWDNRGPAAVEIRIAGPAAGQQSSRDGDDSSPGGSTSNPAL